MRLEMSHTDITRVHMQDYQPDRLPQALQVEHGRSSYRLIMQHANLANYRKEKRGRLRPSGHTHEDSYHVLLYTMGDTEVVLEGRVQAVRPGTLVLSPPGDVHDFRPVRSGVTSYTQVTFAFVDERRRALALSFAELLGAWSGLDLPERGVVLQLDERRREELGACISRVYEAAQSTGATAHLDVRLEMSSLFAWLVRELYLPRTRVSGEGAAGSGLAAARAHVEAHYRGKVSVATLAGIAYLSEGYLLRAFKRAYGVSPIAYQGRLRVDAARGMLRFTSLSCKEIAARLGYGDLYHFSKSFKKREGCSPATYRKRADPV